MMEESGRHTRVRCIRPFTSVELQPKRGVSFCCTEWTKIPYIGNLENKNLLEVWNSDTAQYIRRKMLAGEYEDVCRADVCPVLISEGWKDLTVEAHKDTIFPLTPKHIEDIAQGHTFMEASPTYVLMSNLSACNLKCPMCGPFRDVYVAHERDSPYKHAVERQRELVGEEDAKVIDRVAHEIITQVPDLKILGLTGAGDPLFRPDTCNILKVKGKTPGIRIALYTNGLLMNPKMWKKIKHNAFRYVNVSVDAAKRETYEALRNPGKWDILVDNLKFIGSLRSQGLIPQFFLNFTVMRSNLEEMADFVRLGKDVGCDYIYFQKIRGNIWKRENFFDGPDKDPVLLKRLAEIKVDLKGMPSLGPEIAFGNL